jgi:putative ABC transport system ATP-binding protein
MDAEASRSHSGTAPLTYLQRFLSHYRADVWTVIVYAAFVGLLTLVTPVAVQSVVNTVAFGTVLQPLVVLVALLFFGLLLAGVLRALKAWVVEVLQRRIFVDALSELAERLPRTDWELARERYGEHAMHRYFDVFMVQKTAASLLLGAIDVVLAAGFGLLVLAFYHPILLAFDFALIAIGAAIIFGLGRGGLATAVEESSIKYAIGELLAEVGRPGYAVKDAGGRVYVRQQLDALATEYLHARASHFRVVLRQILGALLTQSVASMALLGLGGWLVIQRELTLGQLVAAELIVTMVVAALIDLGKYLESYYDLATGLYKLGGLLELPMETEGEGAGSGDAAGPAELVLQDVQCSAGGRPVLKGISLRIARGARMALVGPGESGKTLLVELLYGVRRADFGQISIDGVDVRELAKSALRERLALIRGQEIFPGTVLENVQFGHAGVTAGRARAVLQQLDMLEELGRLPDGLETLLGPSGTRLSDSQALRLTLARAMARAPGLIAIDADLASLDSRALRRTLDVLTRPEAPWSLIVVGDHPHILDACKQIARLEKGSIVVEAAP